MTWSIDRLPKYRKHRASGQALVTLGGRDHYLGPHGAKASRRGDERLIAESLASGRSPHSASPATKSPSSSWRQTHSATPASPAVRQRRTNITGPSAWCDRSKGLYGKTPAAEFGPLARSEDAAMGSPFVPDARRRPSISKIPLAGRSISAQLN